MNVEAIKEALEVLAIASPNSEPNTRSLIRDILDPRKRMRKGLTEASLDGHLLSWETGNVVKPVRDQVRKAIEVLRKEVLNQDL